MKKFIKGLALIGALALIFAACPNTGTDVITITPTADDFEIDGLSQTYNGDPIIVSITPKAGKSGGAITILYNGSETAPVEVGDYAVTFNVAASGNYNAVNGLSAGTLEIKPSDLDPDTITPVIDDFDISGLGPFTYNGSQRIVSITSKAGKSGGAITVLYNGSTTAPTDAGAYTVTFNIAASGNYAAVNGLSAGTLVINTATPVAADFDITGLSQTYDGSQLTVSITPKAGKSSGAITILYDGSTTAPTAVGTYTVTFNVAAAGNYTAANGLSAGTLEIVPEGQVATPGANPKGGGYIVKQNVVLTTTTDTASIFYTLDGSAPTTESALYTAPIEINSTTTLKAIAIKEGMTESNALTEVYTIYSIESITVNGPNKTEYITGDSFFSLGLEVTAHYTNGETAFASDYSLSWNSQSLADGNTTITAVEGEKTVTVSYDGKTTSFTITVRLPDPTGIEIGDPSIKLYLDGSTIPLIEGGSTHITTAETGTFTVSIAPGTYSKIIWYLNGEKMTQWGESRTSIVLTKRLEEKIEAVYMITVEVITADGTDTGTHIFVVN